MDRATFNVMGTRRTDVGVQHVFSCLGVRQMIAAIARSRGATLATRNIKDFSDCGIDPINPWTGR